jgi:lipoprotein NlpD
MPQTRVVLVLAVLTSLLAACSGGGILSPDVDYSDASARSPHYRTVVRGDTLFSIAWDVGVDFRTLAAWNNIASPYVIKPGQRIRISRPPGAGKSKSSRGRHARSSGGGYYRVKKGDTVWGIAKKTNSRANDIIAWNGLKKPYSIYPGQKLRVSGKSGSRQSRASRAKTTESSSRQTAPARTGRPKSVGRWMWPTSGKIVRGFNPRGANKGIDISGKAGQSVVAAAGGTVVYQGSGLRGYGQLIIIKHNPDYLSAYAHCSRILVKEGEKVKRGQRIATMGSTGTNRVKLHFEIRQRGNPVNPIKYLPRKT